MLDNPNLALAFSVTLLAGLSTGIGSLLSLLTKKTNTKFLSIALGFSAGVMLYVSFVEIFVKANGILNEALGLKLGSWLTAAAFFGGMLFIALIDKMVPELGNPHETRKVEEMHDKEQKDKASLMRMGVFTALAVALHNFPEGFATFISTLDDPNLGIPIAIAVAIHNIPEGIAVAVPIFYATNNKKKAFTLSFLSGLAEPLGALLGYAIFYKFLTDTVFGLVFAAVAGIMVFISLDELLPAAEKYGEHHLSIYGLIAGMAVMALSLLSFL